MHLKSKRKFCSCGGTIAHYRNRVSKVTIYTQTGPVEVEHLECRCKKCDRGYYYGYASDTVAVAGEESASKQYKIYEEDCLESEASLKKI